jgi:hypothetical protein
MHHQEMLIKTMRTGNRFAKGVMHGVREELSMIAQWSWVFNAVGAWQV